MDLLRRAAEHNYIAGDYERAVALAGRVLELIGDSDPVAVAIARERLGRYLWTSGRHAESAKEYGQAVAEMPAEPPSAERARVLAALASVLMLTGHAEDSRELAEQAIEIARAVEDRSVEAHALNTFGVDLASLGDRESGLAALRESLAIELELGASDNLHRTYTNLADILDQDGQVEEAIGLAREGVSFAKGHGMGPRLGGVRAGRGRQQVHPGRPRGRGRPAGARGARPRRQRGLRRARARGRRARVR